MAQVPPASAIRKATKAVVEDAHSKGNMSNLTIRIVRGLVEEKLVLEPGTLDSKELRRIVKDTILNTKASLPSSSRRESGSPPPEDEALASAPDETEEKEAKSTKATTAKKRQRPEKNSKAFKSAETVPTSDEEDEGNKKLTPKKRKKPVSAKQELVESDQQGSPQPSKSSSVPPITETNAEESDPGVSSDASPPKKKKTKKESKKSIGKEKAPAKSSKGAKEPLSKDEASIKRLKSYVLACGVRKVWGVYFKDSPEPRQQITKLEGLLRELGMKGRFTMDQAKKIQQKRELAQELEDVTTFEQSMKARGKRASRSAKADLDSDEEMAGVEDVKARRKSALQSINAFLDSQSEDED